MSGAGPSPGLIAALLLAVIQGLTEFLPISSSGHLVAAQELWPGLDQTGVTLELALHVGTTLAVVIYYRRLLGTMVRSAISGSGEPDGLSGRSWIALLFAGSLPTALVGLAGEEMIRGAFESIHAVAAALAFTGVVLMATLLSPADDRRVGFWDALLIGFAQGIAIFPGVSRSGMTISVAVLLGVRRSQAVSFSFLLSIPAVLGATVLENSRQLAEQSAVGNGFLSPQTGFATLCAGAVGYACIGLVHRATRDEWWHRFAWYCWILAVLLVLFAG